MFGKFKLLHSCSKDILITSCQHDSTEVALGVLRKKCSEIMQQIYRRKPMPKCDFNKVALQFY